MNPENLQQVVRKKSVELKKRSSKDYQKKRICCKMFYEQSIYTRSNSQNCLLAS